MSDVSTCSGDQNHCGLPSTNDTTIHFARVGQRRARHLAAESHMVQLALHRTQTCLDVAQTLPIGQLREDHGKILIPAGKSAQPDVALIALDRTAKTPGREGS